MGDGYHTLRARAKADAASAEREYRKIFERVQRAEAQADPALGFSKAELKALDYATEWVGDVEPDTPISTARAKLQRSLEARNG